MSRTVFSGYTYRRLLVVITRPDCYEGETEQITLLLNADPHFLLHLRKPEAAADDYRKILDRLPATELHRITLGGHHELAEDYPVGGVHLNGRGPAYTGIRHDLRLSRSCHSITELNHIEDYTYVFLSPIFNSISKEGYQAAFSSEALTEACQSGIINSRVIALGGISAATLPLLAPYSFGGAAVLGAVWQNFDLNKFRELVKEIGR